jgi:hypothetical protein
MASKNQVNFTAYLLVIGLVVLYVTKGLGKFAEFFGIKKTEAEANVDAALNVNSQSPWNPHFHKNSPAGTLMISPGTAVRMAKEIYDAFGVFNDDEQKVYSVFRRLPSKASCSFLVQVFSDKYGLDLLLWLGGATTYTDLHDGLEKKELDVVLKIVNNLPTYK